MQAHFVSKGFARHFTRASDLNDNNWLSVTSLRCPDAKMGDKELPARQLFEHNAVLYRTQNLSRDHRNEVKRTKLEDEKVKVSNGFAHPLLSVYMSRAKSAPP